MDVYWEDSEIEFLEGGATEIYALGYDPEYNVWVSFRESDRIDWDVNSGIKGFFFTQDPQFHVPENWEIL